MGFSSTASSSQSVGDPGPLILPAGVSVKLGLGAGAGFGSRRGGFIGHVVDKEVPAYRWVRSGSDLVIMGVPPTGPDDVPLCGSA